MKGIVKAVSTAVSAILYIFAISVAALAVASLLGVKSYIVMSGSMEPNIHTGSLCIVNTNIGYDDIVVNDVIAYKTHFGDLVTHRVIDITDKGMETKGDANDTSDGISTTKENFYGKTLFSIPYAGYLVFYIQRPVVLGIIVILFGLLCTVSSMLTKEEKCKSK